MAGSRGANLYRRLPVRLQNAVMAVKGRQLHRLRFGGVHAGYRERIERTQWLGSEELEAYQVREARLLLRHAAAAVPAYQEQRDVLLGLAETMHSVKDLAVLPLLEKSSVNARSESYHSTRPDGRRIYGGTSGTSGRPIRTLKTPAAYQRNWAFLARTRGWHGTEMGSRRATFGGRMVVPAHQSRPPFWRREPAENNLYFSIVHLSEEHLDAYIEKLLAYRPEQIVSYPSALVVVARRMERRGVRLDSVRAVYTSAETLFDEQRQTLQRAFSGRVVNMYGQGENAVWIAECPEGRLHVASDYGITEFLPLGPPGLHEITGTGFVNPAMPLLRYRTGDEAEITPADAAPCPCGRMFPTVSRVVGRIEDHLVTSDGRILTRLDGVFKGLEGIAGGQIEQIGYSELVVRIVPLPGSDARRGVEECTRRLEEIFGKETRVDALLVEELPRTAAGKVRFTVNRIPGADPAR